MPSPPRLSTFADFVRLHYGLACDCKKCGRSVRLNLAALILQGKGDRHVHRTRPVCHSCGAVGTYRIIRPDPRPFAQRLRSARVCAQMDREAYGGHQADPVTASQRA